MFLVIVYVCEPWMALRCFAYCLRVGLRWVVLTLAFEWTFGRLRGEAFVGEHCGGVQLIARGTDAGRAGHFCDDGVDCVAITPGMCESLKEGWLGGRVAPDVSSVGMEGQ